MPRYFFKTYHGLSVHDDNQGLELENNDAAKREAMKAASEILGGLGSNVVENEPWSMQVTDENRKGIWHLTFLICHE